MAASDQTAIEVLSWFNVWGAYSPYGEEYGGAVEHDGHSFDLRMLRIYGKLGSSEVQSLDALWVSTEATIPFALSALEDEATWEAAAEHAKRAYEEVREPIRRLALRTIEYLRLERPDLDLGQTADRGPYRPEGREHEVWVSVQTEGESWTRNPDRNKVSPEALNRFMMRKLWSREADKEVDVSKLPLLRPGEVDRATQLAAKDDPEYSRLMWRDAHDYRRDARLRLAVILAVTASETRFKEVATGHFQAGWNAVLGMRTKPTFGFARQHEKTVFGTTYAAQDAAADKEMWNAIDLRNDLIHNALTAREPTDAAVDDVLSAVDAYFAWLDAR